MKRLTELEEVLFPVEEHPVFVSITENNREVRLPVPDKKGIVNGTTGRVLSVVSRGYRLVTNRQALDMATDCCRAVFPDTKPGEWGVTTIDGPSTAGHCRMDLMHNSTALDFSFVPASERPEAFGPFIRVTNSYNGLRALAFDIGFYRKVCKNGLIMPDSIIRFTFSHQHREIGERIRFDVSHQQLAALKSSFGEYIGALRSCAIAQGDFDDIVRGVLCLPKAEPLNPSTARERDWNLLASQLGTMSARYADELGENAYAVFNVITEFASHPPDNLWVRRDRHSLQVLAGSWLNNFSRECRKPEFSLAGYLDQLNKPKGDAERQHYPARS